MSTIPSQAEFQPGLALDIDETLSWTIGYWVKEMQQLFGNPENLTPLDLIKKYRYTHNVPYWQTPEAEAWLNQQRSSNDVQEILPLIEDADNIVRQIHRIIPIKAYLTVRPEVVIPGTERWLRNHDFPEARIIARPMDRLQGNSSQWKSEILTGLYPEVVGIVDDNPSLVEALPADYPGVIFLYDAVESPRNDIRVITCPTWHDVLAAVTSYVGERGVRDARDS